METASFFLLSHSAGNLFSATVQYSGRHCGGKIRWTQALAAVGGTTGVIINLLVGFFVGLSSGATVVISQYYGARKTVETSRAVHTSMALGVAGGLFFMVLGMCFSPFMLQAMGTPKDVMGDSILYIEIYFAGMLFNLIYNMGSGILRR